LVTWKKHRRIKVKRRVREIKSKRVSSRISG